MLTLLLFLCLPLISIGHPGDTALERQKRAAPTIQEVDLWEPSGKISTPGFHEGQLYPLNTDITWTLHFPDQAVYNVAIDITFMDIEENAKCTWDFLEFGRNFSHRLCGDHTGLYKVHELMGQTKLRFVSDFYLTKTGFELSYSIHKVTHPCAPNPCLNNGVCTRQSESGYICSCTEHFSGKNCHVVDDSKHCTEYPCMIFEENFDYINPKLWQHEITLSGGGNWEFQYYTNNVTNSYCRNGTLYLKPTLTEHAFGYENNFLDHGTIDIWGMGPHETCTSNAFWGCKRVGSGGNLLNPVQSARIRSSRGFNFKYGKVEVEAKLPVGDWIWPAIWMLPTWNVYGTWPASGEIDIMESRGNINYTAQDGEPEGVDRVGSTIHYGPNWKHNGYIKATASKRLYNGSTFADRFYRYGVEWTEDHIRLTVDDEEILKVAPDSGGFWKFGDFSENMTSPWKYATKMAPFDQEFYIILNVAVGGMNFFPDEFINGPKPKPWAKADQNAFWRAKDDWYPTWNPDENDGEDAAMKINHVKVWKLSPE